MPLSAVSRAKLEVTGLILAIAMLLAGCVIDEPANADLDGTHYWATCTVVRSDLLGSALPDAQTPDGPLQALALIGTDPHDAIAVLAPPDRCGTSKPAWVLYFNADLSQDETSQLISQFEDPAHARGGGGGG